MTDARDWVVEAPPAASVSVARSEGLFPVHRVYCVGRNYADHAQEMGHSGREAPFFFCKPPDSVTMDSELPFPGRTAELHHEVELVAALAKGGHNLSPDETPEMIYGYAVGVDLTRRDLQSEAKSKGRPWDTAKGFERSAPISAITPVEQYGHPQTGNISLSVNGRLRQSACLSQMIWKVPEILAELSQLFELKAGDLVFTGTPAGVGMLRRGDQVSCRIDGLEPLNFSFSDDR